MNPPTRLHQCETPERQVAWTAAALRKGATIDETSLWLAGVDRPMRVIAAAKAILRSEGLVIGKRMRDVRDAAGIEHRMLSWSVVRT